MLYTTKAPLLVVVVLLCVRIWTFHCTEPRCERRLRLTAFANHL